jgi:exo-1,4-beta-D-glucosaminidase
MEYDSERAMFEAYGKNKYVSTGVIQWMLNNAWPSMIWHLYDYYLDAGAGYFAAKKACEPVHIQYSYDDHSIVVVNSTYESPPASTPASTSTTWPGKSSTRPRNHARCHADSASASSPSPTTSIPAPDRIFFIDLTLSDASGRVLSRNFYWVPTTLTTFDWAKTDYTHTPAARHEDLTALANAPKPNSPPAPRSRTHRAAAKCACTSTTPPAHSPSRSAPPFALNPAASSPPSSGPTTGSNWCPRRIPHPDRGAARCPSL